MKRALCLLLIMLLTLPLCAQAEEAAPTDWYTETANGLIADLYELISFEQFREYFFGSDEMHAQIDAWKAALSEGALRVTGYDMPDAALLLSMAGMADSDLPSVVQEYLDRRMGSTLVSMVNGSYGGAALLAASSMTVVTEGYLMPEGFAPCIILFEYDGICVSVSFAQIGEGVVMGTAQFTAPEIVGLLNGTYEE